MNTRNWLTLISGLCVALGPQMQLNAPAPWVFWLGNILTTAGGAILASKAFTSTEDPK